MDDPAGPAQHGVPSIVGSLEKPTGSNPSELSLPATSPGISISDADELGSSRPALGTHASAPAAPQGTYQSPLRQHRRTPSAHRQVKETLNAVSQYTDDDRDGFSKHRINQYIIAQEIGRGSYGAVHLCKDQFGNEYAVKEFSKVRLRKRAQSNILRHGPRRPGRFVPRSGVNAPYRGALSDHQAAEERDSLFLIREEIAIMKKLNHPNLVQLIEVLDDPEEDSLYMVLEMCKKGVIMKVGLGEPATPHPEDLCRTWFRDLILGIEYLHAQGVVHRDIKPDNLLLTDDDVLKIVDFGVSEMFQKQGDMMTGKSAGSPAFLPPELCVAKHGEISGKAADIWSMGVSLYCLRYGKIPFENYGVLEMYDAIKTQPASMPDDEGDLFRDLMDRLLEKDPAKRIQMSELREHPWVTNQGKDPLLSAEENCSDLVDPPNALEVNHAFTRRMTHMFYVMKAISKFKSLLHDKDANPTKSESAQEQAISPGDKDETHTKQDEIAALVHQWQSYRNVGEAENKKEFTQATAGAQPPYLGIGTGGLDDFESEDPEPGVVSDSPTAVEFSVYDRAYEAEVERIKAHNHRSMMYLTRHVNDEDRFKEQQDSAGGRDRTESAPTPSAAQPNASASMTPNRLADLVASTMLKTKSRT